MQILTIKSQLIANAMHLLNSKNLTYSRSGFEPGYSVPEADELAIRLGYAAFRATLNKGTRAPLCNVTPAKMVHTYVLRLCPRSNFRHEKCRYMCKSYLLPGRSLDRRYVGEIHR
jgi:hypothetical protein